MGRRRLLLAINLTETLDFRYQILYNPSLPLQRAKTEHSSAPFL